MNGTKICVHCGKEFVPCDRRIRKYCSPECALAVDEERHREYSRRHYAEHRDEILARKRRVRQND